MRASNSAREFLKEKKRKRKQKVLWLFLPCLPKPFRIWRCSLKMMWSRPHAGRHGATGGGCLHLTWGGEATNLSPPCKTPLPTTLLPICKNQEGGTLIYIYLLFYWIPFSLLPQTSQGRKGSGSCLIFLAQGSFYHERHERKPYGFAVIGGRIFSHSFLCWVKEGNSDIWKILSSHNAGL